MERYGVRSQWDGQVDAQAVFDDGRLGEGPSGSWWEIAAGGIRGRRDAWFPGWIRRSVMREGGCRLLRHVDLSKSTQEQAVMVYVKQ